ncbi:GNAT family N-acetyltransferase [Saccharomonospora piscinae]|uniref:GNAT family N-acetyltransferase n=1 Tax=Saccharomonospora piscinae TaxID=687388 RepID=A0A1V9A5B8_SACPI|nr:GNAT family N-acetyltransferase [Saccharomonospora piscinae]OQO92271.1 GNAT family N-acetyltransferase [Saccharomonospora piscinae]
MTRRLEPLRTRRLLLRPFTDADLAVVVGIQSARDTHPHESAPRTPQEARTQFDSWRQHWAEHGYGYLAVERTGIPGVIGVGGVQATELGGERVLNLYYRFRPEVWGRGYAPEMAAEVLRWAQRELPERPVVIVTNVTNAPARRVAAKLAFREYRRALYAGAPAVYYRRDPAHGAVGGTGEDGTR